MTSAGECVPCGAHYASLQIHNRTAKHLRAVGLMPPLVRKSKPSKRCEHDKIKTSCTTCSAHLFTWCDRCLTVCQNGGAFDRHLQTTAHHTFGLLTYPGPADVGPHVWDTERFMPPLGPQMPPGMKYKSDVFGIDPATGRLVLVRWA